MSSENWAFDEIRNPACQQCELYKTAQVPCLVGQGPREAKIMIVGEAPGWREEDIKRVFSGPAGKRLDLELKRVGLDRSQIYITNVVKCRPPENRTPEKEEIKACENYLQKEIEIVQPTYLLLLGNPALWGVLRKSGITRHRGETNYVGKMTVIPTFHPAAIGRNPSLIPYFEEDLDRFSQFTREEIKAPELDITIINTLEKMRELICSIKENPTFAYDVETEGLFEWVPFARLWCLGIAISSERAWVIPLEHPDHAWNEFEQDQIHKALVFFFETLKRRRVAHNGEFDNRWLRSRGIDAQHDFDTMIAAYLIDENLSRGLKPLSRRFLNAGFYEAEIDVTQHPPPLEALCNYCGEDACHTFALREIFREKLLADQGLTRVFKRLLMPATKIISKLEATGIYIDQERLQQRTKLAKAQREILINKLDKFLPDMDTYKEMNWNSTSKLRTLLYTTLKLPIPGYTEKGKPSTAEPLIKQLKDEHPIIPILLQFREKDKRLNTFLIPWKEWAQYDGRLHPNYNLTGTVTGRASCNDPNLQQTERGEFIRGIISAPEGWQLISADLKQAEMRIAAMLSHDPNLMKVFSSGKDIHLMTAKTITGKTVISKAERKRAKAVNFGLIFGMGWRGLQEYAREKYDVIFTDEEARQVRRAYFTRYPKLLVWHQKQRDTVRQDYQVKSPIGRIRRLPNILSSDPEIRAEAERQAINSPVQSLSFDICLLSTVLLDPDMNPEEIRLVGLIHDCLLFECRDDIINIWVDKIKSVMEHLPLKEMFDFEPPVPIEVDVKVSKYWEGEE